MIYLDYAATTPVDDRVLQVMLPYFQETFGNPSSVHRYGQKAEAAVDTAREVVAEALSCLPHEVIFTSCGSEADNLALRGSAMAIREQTGARRLISCRTEHNAVSRTVEHLVRYHDFEAVWLEPDAEGVIQPEVLEKAITPDTALVSLMYANNEIGSIHPIRALADIAHKHGALFHSDAVQGAAYLSVDVQKLGVDMLSLSGHKFYGPKGVGALYVRHGTPLIQTQTGGGHEFGWRAGTHNVSGIVGFAEALRLTVAEREARAAHLAPLRDKIIGHVLENIPESRLSGPLASRLPNHASFVFHGVDGNLLLTLLDSAGFACSSGSACKTGNPEPSAVLTSLGLSREWALGSLRVTLGMGNTPEQVESFAQALPGLVEQARKLSRN